MNTATPETSFNPNFRHIGRTGIEAGFNSYNELIDCLNKPVNKPVIKRSMYEELTSLRGVAQKILYKSDIANRISVCGNIAVSNVKIIKTKRGVITSGIGRCGCKHTCPYCSFKSGIEESQKLGFILNNNFSENKVLMLTFTSSSVYGSNLRSHLKSMNEVWKRVFVSSFKESLSRKFGFKGYNRVLDYTYNLQTDQHHPHYAALLVVNGDADTAKIRDLLFSRFKELSERCGITMVKPAFYLEEAESDIAATNYIYSKFQKTGFELYNSHYKSAHGSNLNIWQMYAAVRDMAVSNTKIKKIKKAIYDFAESTYGMRRSVRQGLLRALWGEAPQTPALDDTIACEADYEPATDGFEPAEIELGKGLFIAIKNLGLWDGVIDGVSKKWSMEDYNPAIDDIMELMNHSTKRQIDWVDWTMMLSWLNFRDAGEIVRLYDEYQVWLRSGGRRGSNKLFNQGAPISGL